MRYKFDGQIKEVLRIACQNLFEFIPDDLTFEYKPLRTLTAEQEQNVKNSHYDRLQRAYDTGLIDDVEFKNKIQEYDLL